MAALRGKHVKSHYDERELLPPKIPKEMQKLRLILGALYLENSGTTKRRSQRIRRVKPKSPPKGKNKANKSAGITKKSREKRGGQNRDGSRKEKRHPLVSLQRKR